MKETNKNTAAPSIGLASAGGIVSDIGNRGGANGDHIHNFDSQANAIGDSRPTEGEAGKHGKDGNHE